MATHFDTPDLEPRDPLEQDENTDDAMFAVTSAAVMEIRKATDDLAAGAISVDDWYEVMADIIATYHLVAYMVGKDSDEVTDEELDALAEAVAEQWGYLEAFREALRDEPNNSALSGKYRNRAEMYGEAVGASWWRGRTYYLETPFWPLDRVQCLTRCRCGWRIEEVDADAGDYDATWLRKSGDNCDTCKERSRLKPLRIRGGKYDRDQITAGMYA